MTPINNVFDSSHQYGAIDSGDLPEEAFETMARCVLPSGTAFMVLEYSSPITGVKGRAWYYSPDGTIPNPDRVKCIKECIA